MRDRPKRLFGSEPSSDVVIKSIVIDEGDWIQGISVAVNKGVEGLHVSDQIEIVFVAFLSLQE